jgi:hypothetical protein
LAPARLHAYGNVVALSLALLNLGLRWDIASANVLPWGLGVSVLVVGILSITAWLGGELAYKYHVGMAIDWEAEQQERPRVEPMIDETSTEETTISDRVRNAKQQRYRRAS